jgi:hypothetical protein
VLPNYATLKHAKVIAHLEAVSPLCLSLRPRAPGPTRSKAFCQAGGTAVANGASLLDRRPPAAINRFVKEAAVDPTPFAWTVDPDKVMIR